MALIYRHIPDVGNVGIIEIYKRYKLSDIKYALTDVASYTVAYTWGPAIK